MKLLNYIHSTSLITNEIPEQTLSCGDITLVATGPVFYTFNNVEYTVNSGDAIIFQKGDIRSRFEFRSPVEYFTFNFVLDETDRLPEMHGVLRSCFSTEVTQLIALYEKCISSHAGFNTQRGTQYFKSLYLTLYEFMQNKKANVHVENIKRYINENIYDQITLESIADAVFISQNYCNTLFKKETGLTISEYIMAVKIEEAKKLIIKGVRSLNEISTSLGYTDYSYFSRVFKRTQGISPKQFKTIYGETDSENESDPDRVKLI